MIGKTLSHYEVLEELGRGELQVVYRARDQRLGREVALKILPPERVREPDRRSRFVEEATAAARLEHPHIGVIHEIDEADGALFIAMELLGGKSLADRMEEGPLPLDEALDIAIGIAQGLGHAHEHGVVHRDVKPANVMFTSGGHPKLIDFGLAKLVSAAQNPFLSEAREQDPALRSTTSEEVIAGTVSYMSPEQARGGRVDPRSDLFSFGALLYHMVAGRPPFDGVSRLDTLYAILQDPTPKLPSLGHEERQILQPIVDRCLAKDPDERYVSAEELVSDLKKGRLRLEAGQGSGLKAGLAAAIAVAAIAGSALFFATRETPAPAPTAEKPSLAVLHFENLSGDPELEWLRTGLTDMLVTDLAQSPELEVLGTDRLHQILEDMDRYQRGAMPPDVLQELARRASVSTVVRGSFAKAGDSIRLSARLEDANTGRVLLSEKAEGVGQESVFRLVDQVSARIKANFAVGTPGGELDRDLRDVTTASVEAYRSYAEGIRLHERFREEEAVPHFQRAVELDPGFAMALAKLGVVHSNLGMNDEANEYAEAALEHVDRLSERERYYIEGWYYSRKPETRERALAAYRKAIELYPDHGSARHNLGNLLLSLEDYEGAIEQFEELRRRGMTFPATYENLANAYRARGDIGRARAVLSEYSADHPDDPTTVLALAQLLIEEGEVEAGLEELAKAEALGAGSFRTAPVRWEAQILTEQWEAAAETAEAMASSESSVEKYFGGRLASVTSLYRGSYRDVLAGIDTYVESASETNRAAPLGFKARILLEMGENEEALSAALRAQEEADVYGGGRDAIAIAAIASARLSRVDEAEGFAERLGALTDVQPGLGAPRLHELVRGEIALARGDYDTALAHYAEAESMLAARGQDGLHTVIWYGLATAHREAGNESEALSWYERISEATGERLLEPLNYVRSFYFIGQLEARLGDDEAAIDAYQRFLDHWEGGEIDRDRVREARAFVD